MKLLSHYVHIIELMFGQMAVMKSKMVGMLHLRNS